MSKWQSERSIHEMLKDTPPLRESSDSITSGTEPKFPTSRSMPFPPAYAPPDVSQNGAGSSTLLRAGSSKLDAIRNWGVSTYKCTKQILYEKLGKSSRTVDTELEAQIEMLRETQRKYAGVLRLSGALTAQLGAAAATQRALGEAFAELAQKSPELQNQFLYNADTQRTLTRNGETLLAALHFFNNSLNTLTNKTIEDTLLTIRQYEAARCMWDMRTAQCVCVCVWQGGVRRVPQRAGGQRRQPARAAAGQHRAPPPTLRAPARRLRRQAQAAAREQGEGDEQAAAAVPQRSVSVLQRQQRGAGGGRAAFQHPPAARRAPSRRAARALARARGRAQCGRDVSGARAPAPRVVARGASYRRPCGTSTSTRRPRSVRP